MKDRSIRTAENHCLACMKPQSQSLAQHKPGVMVYVCNPSILELEENQKFTIILSYKANLGHKNIQEVGFKKKVTI